MKIKKAMLSQPMACLPENEIKETRERAIQKLEEKGSDYFANKCSKPNYTSSK